MLEIAKKVTALYENIKQIDIQQKKLTLIQNEKKNLDVFRHKYRQTISTLLEYHSEFHEKLFEGKGKILGQDIISGDLTFQLEVQHKTQSFIKEFLNEVFENNI